MWVQSLLWEDPLEKDIVTHSSISVWEIPWLEEPNGLQFHGVTKSWTWLSYYWAYMLNTLKGSGATTQNKTDMTRKFTGWLDEENTCKQKLIWGQGKPQKEIPNKSKFLELILIWTIVIKSEILDEAHTARMTNSRHRIF